MINREVAPLPYSAAARAGSSRHFCTYTLSHSLTDPLARCVTPSARVDRLGSDCSQPWSQVGRSDPRSRVSRGRSFSRPDGLIFGVCLAAGGSAGAPASAESFAGGDLARRAKERGVCARRPHFQPVVSRALQSRRTARRQGATGDRSLFAERAGELAAGAQCSASHACALCISTSPQTELLPPEPAHSYRSLAPPWW
jgi:hypothetical protein